MKRSHNKKTKFYLKMMENKKYLSVYWNIRLLNCLSSTSILTSFIEEFTLSFCIHNNRLLIKFNFE